MEEMKPWVERPFYSVPDHGSCHGTCRRMQGFCVMNLPYRSDFEQLTPSMQVEIQSLKYIGKSKSKFSGRLLTTETVRCRQQVYVVCPKSKCPDFPMYELAM